MAYLSARCCSCGFSLVNIKVDDGKTSIMVPCQECSWDNILVVEGLSTRNVDAGNKDEQILEALKKHWPTGFDWLARENLRFLAKFFRRNSAGNKLTYEDRIHSKNVHSIITTTL